jgi:hypothetical protein
LRTWAINESVQIRRHLAATKPYFRGNLARSLTSLGVRLTERGDLDAALAAAREAAALYSELATLDPSHYHESLQQAARNLVSDLRALGRSGPEIAEEFDRLSLREP